MLQDVHVFNACLLDYSNFCPFFLCFFHTSSLSQIHWFYMLPLFLLNIQSYSYFYIYFPPGRIISRYQIARKKIHATITGTEKDEAIAANLLSHHSVWTCPQWLLFIKILCSHNGIQNYTYAILLILSNNSER